MPQATDSTGAQPGRTASAVRPGCGTAVAGGDLRYRPVCLMASVEPWRWTLCEQYTEAGRVKPAREDGCRCKITAWRTRWWSPEGKARGKVFRRKRDADVHAANVESSKAAGTYVDPGRGRQRLANFAREWAEGQDWKDTTREAWPYIEARLDPLIGKAQLAAVDQLLLKRVRAALAKEYAHATVKLTMAYAAMIMRAAYTSGRIGRDPTAGPRAPKARAGDPTGQVGPEHVPTRSEALAILANTPSQFRAAIALGLAGLRVGEVLGMTADRIDLDKRRGTVDRQMQRIGNESRLTTPKAEKVRTITRARPGGGGASTASSGSRRRGHPLPGTARSADASAVPVLFERLASGAQGSGLGDRSVRVPCLPPLVRLDPPGRGRAAYCRGRAPRRHGGDGLPDLRPLAAGRPGHPGPDPRPHVEPRVIRASRGLHPR
jgi:integrase